MHKSVTTAVARLQARSRRSTNVEREAVLLEALDILLSRPFQADPPHKLIQRAIDQARRRRRRRKRAVAGNLHKLRWLPSEPPSHQERLDALALVAKAPLADDARVLRLVLGGADPIAISDQLGIAPASARSRVCRARRRLAEACIA